MDLFSPLGKDHCLLFYVLSVLAFAIFVVTLALGIFGMKKNWMGLALAAAAPLFTYYVYRILFSVCQASLL
jgi:hypothetical protein